MECGRAVVQGDSRVGSLPFIALALDLAAFLDCADGSLRFDDFGRGHTSALVEGVLELGKALDE